MSETITFAIKMVMGWAAVIAGASIIYGIVKTIKPDFDKKLWK